MISENNQINFWLSIDRNIIEASVKQNGIYSDDNMEIKQWEGENHRNYYIGKISKSNTVYVGVLNIRLEKIKFGLNVFDNKDIYLGEFDCNIKKGEGIYSYSQAKNRRELYCGEFEEDTKSNAGVYFWVDYATNLDYNSVSFELFIGEFKNASFSKGVYLVKREKEYYLYYGKYDENGLKHDNNCMFYDITNDCFIFGQIEKDEMKSGYLVNFKERDNFLYVEYDNNIPKEQITKGDVDSEILKVKALNIKNLLISQNYFGKYYDYFVNINTKLTELTGNYEQTMEILNNSKTFDL